jgi:hypothetical protein
LVTALYRAYLPFRRDEKIPGLQRVPRHPGVSKNRGVDAKQAERTPSNRVGQVEWEGGRPVYKADHRNGSGHLHPRDDTNCIELSQCDASFEATQKIRPNKCVADLKVCP